MGPREDSVPEAVHEAGVLGRNDAVVISLVGVLAYPDGVAFRLHVVARSHGDSAAPWMPAPEPRARRLGRFRRKHNEGLPRLAPLASGSVGVEYRDGTGTECTLSRFDPMSRLTLRRPSPPVIAPMSGSAGGSQNWWVIDHGFWLWPLPPPEPFMLVAAWPALGLDPVRREMDGAAIVAAAARAAPAWPTG